MRFLRRGWRLDPDEVRDLRQETYARVFQAAAKSRPAHARAFLFTTAKHLLTDRIRRQRVITIDTVADLDALNLMIDDISPERRAVARQDLRTLAVAFDCLPPRCRDTVWMRRVDELPQKEVAARLGITQKMVEKHLALGMKRLADALFGHEASELNACPDSQQGPVHGKQQAD